MPSCACATLAACSSRAGSPGLRVQTASSNASTTIRQTPRKPGSTEIGPPDYAITRGPGMRTSLRRAVGHLPLPACARYAAPLPFAHDAVPHWIQNPAELDLRTAHHAAPHGRATESTPTPH